jgi:hypothetical protein
MIFSYLDRSVNPWDVWPDDTPDRRECPERITDLLLWKHLYKSLGLRRQTRTRARLFESGWAW